jgi:hypothetical protein
LDEVHAYVCYWLYIFCTNTSSGGNSAKHPRHRAEALERRHVKSRGEGEEVPSLEKKVEGWIYVVKAEGPGPRGGCWGTAVGYAYAGADVSGGRRGEAFGAG